MPEPLLIQRLKNRNDASFAELVRLFGSKVYNTALGFVQNAEVAEEITQDVFVKVFENIKSFREEAALSTWIYRIAVTQALDYLRKQKKQKGLLSLFSKGKDEWDCPDFYHPGVITEQKETSAILFKAIRQLPEQQQTAFLLQKLENLSQADIAGVLNTSAGAVESLLQRAKANLRKRLEEYYQKEYK